MAQNVNKGKGAIKFFGDFKKTKKLLSKEYESVVNSIQELIFIVNMEGKMIGFNDKFARSVKPCIRKNILGTKFEVILKKYWGKNDLEKGCKKTIENVILKKSINKENEFLKPSLANICIAQGVCGDEEGVFKIRSFPSFDRAGEIIRIVCVLNNISGLRVVDGRLKNVTELNEKILKNVPVGIVTMDTKGIITHMNPYAKYLIGDRNGKNIFNMNFIKDNSIASSYKELLKTGKNFFKKERRYFYDKRNKSMHLNVRVVPLKNGDGTVGGGVAIVDDVTENVESKIQIEKMNQDLESKIVERTRQLKEAINLKTRFIADASHELRTPLTIMKGNLDLLLKSNVFDAESKAMVNTVEEQVDYMAKMLVDLTMLAKGDKNFSDFKMHKFDFVKLIEDIANVFNVVAKKYNINLTFGKQRSLDKIIVKGDQDKIERMVNNLVSNAIKYNKKDDSGWIKIFLKKRNNRILMSIEDNGMGIPKKDLPYIFERFYRTDKARAKQEEGDGTGLGLAICKWVAETHGGKITVESKAGKGSVFNVFLPYVE